MVTTYQQTVVGRGSLSAILEFSSTDFACGNYHDGSVWVYVGPDCNGFRVVSWTPNTIYSQGIVDLHGAMLNIPGNPSGQGFNAYAPNFNSASSFDPSSTILNHGDCLVISNGINSLNNVIRRNFPLVNSNANTALTVKRFFNFYEIPSYILEMLAIFAVNKMPSSAESVRPPAFGPKSERIKWLSQPEPTINYNQITNGVFDQSYTDEWPENSETADSFSEFCGDVFSFPACRGLLPARQHPGIYLPATVSEGLVKLLDSVSGGTSNPDRKDAILKMVQWGVDLWSTYKNGRISSETEYVAGQEAVNAHLFAHKALIIFAGLMLNDKSMSDPDLSLSTTYGANYTPSNVYSGIGRFAENGVFFDRSNVASSVWWGGRWARYNTTVSTVTYASSNNYQFSSPMVWSAFTPSAVLYSNATYSVFTDVVMRSLQGIVMFMSLMDKTKEYGKSIVGGIIQEYEFWWGSQSKHSNLLSTDFNLTNPQFFQQIRNGKGPMSLYCGNTRFGGRNRGGVTTPNIGLPCVSNVYAVTPDFLCQALMTVPYSYGIGVPYSENYVMRAWRRFMFSEFAADNRLGIKSYPGIQENVRNPNSASGGGGILTTVDKFGNNKVRLELMDHPPPSSVYFAILQVGEMTPQGYAININVLPSASPVGYIYPNSVNPFAPLAQYLTLNDRGTTVIELNLSTYYTSDGVKKFPTVGFQVHYLMNDLTTWCASNALEAVFI